MPGLDLVLPCNAAGPGPAAHDTAASQAAQAWAAWEAAVCWDEEHSVRRLDEVRTV